MTKQHMAMARRNLTMPDAWVRVRNHRLWEDLLAALQEWQTRRAIKRDLCHLSDFHLQDAGLIKADIEAACTDSLDRSAARALNSAAQYRPRNW